MADEFIGKTIGGYEVQRVIGRGGMATVYLARQQSMNRQVALKVLPQQFANDDTYLQRFEREVAIVSKLEHRNIIPVYDYGEHEGMPYIVMRYMPAGSVDDLLLDGPMPPEQVLNIVAQVAPALDYAHTKDVLHRDFKPSNVLLDDDGGAFITDFGIARLAGEGVSAITTQGVVGTPSYMSPEQAQGKPLDGRSDVYALGVMIFEMITGRRPFESETPYSIAVMQVTTPPPRPTSINPAVSSVVEKVILKSLSKKADDRYDTAVQLYEALRMAVEHPEKALDTEPNLPMMHPSQGPPIGQSIQQPYQPHQQGPLSLPMGNTPGQYPVAQSSGSMAQVPSGRMARLKQRRKSNPLMSVFMGGAIGCGLLAALVALGAIALLLFITTNDGIGANPTQEALIGANITASAPVTAEPLPTLNATERAAQQTLEARDADNQATLTADARLAALTPTSTESIFAPVGVRGTPTLRPALTGVTGTIIFADRRGEDEQSFEIVSLNLENWIETQLTNDPSDNTFPQASPNGLWIAYQSDADGDNDIFVVNRAGGQRQRITNNSYTDYLAAWSPDGEWILYSSDVRGDGLYDLYRTRFDGTETELVFSNRQRNSHARYSPDGRYIVFTTGPASLDASTWEIALLDTETNEVQMLTNNNVRDGSPVFRPDGEQIMYISYNGVNNAIYVMDVDGTNARLLYDSAGSDWAANYSPDGQYIVFSSNVTGDDQLFLMLADGSNVQQITSTGGGYASWIPPRSE
ncbi:protein kinase [Phototrophicus methaneseepsis]|uniref:non-specific serine/threonine protein kinase n=1 Tax=Phototrophicus methaneseepsis TaxID=2710758 RepID=A0A7S8EBH6_9CHLR|nr:protein kinase [Phototrophicus methaneseepsis]QPC83935.1 protein kinase [Phototrophicus methaneseepsis]